MLGLVAIRKQQGGLCELTEKTFIFTLVESFLALWVTVCLIATKLRYFFTPPLL